MNFESYKQEMKQDVKSNMEYENMMGMTDNMCCGGVMNTTPTMMGCATPIYECPRENVCHRYICYEVPHIMPCNTRIINHHIYRHTYRPEYTCCEENVCENVFERPCC